MKFEILNGPEDGKIIEINKKEITFGRLPDKDIIFSYAKKITRIHGKFYEKQGKVFVVDMGKEGKGSKNGIEVMRENEKVEIWKNKITVYKDERKEKEIEGNEIEIKPGDTIIIGKNIWLRYLG